MNCEPIDLSHFVVDHQRSQEQVFALLGDLL